MNLIDFLLKGSKIMPALQDKLANIQTVMDQSIAALNAKQIAVESAVTQLNEQIADLQTQLEENGTVTIEELEAVAVKASQILTAINAIPPVIADE